MSSSLTAKAQEQTTFYDHVIELYEKGSAPTQEEILGWNSGRCYWPENKNKPENVLLSAWVEKDTSNHGPISPPRDIYKAIPFADLQKAANHYDNLDDDQINKVYRGIENYSPILSKLYLNDNSLNSDQGSQTRYSIRKSGPYFVFLMHSKRQGQEEIRAVCYTFKKVK